MTKSKSQGETLQNPYFMHATEFEGRAPADAASTEIAVENAKMTIRALISDNRRALRREALPELAPQVEISALEPLSATRAAPEPRKPGLARRLHALRPGPRHLFWALAFGLVWWQPVATLIAMFIGFCCVLTGQMVFGAERMQQIRGTILHRLSRLAPRLTLRRVPEPDPFAGRPDPLDRIVSEPR